VGFHGAAEDVSKALGFDPSWSATIAGPYTLQCIGAIPINISNHYFRGPSACRRLLYGTADLINRQLYVLCE